MKRRSLLAKVFVRLFILPAHPLYHASTPFYTSQLLLCRSCYPDPAIHTRAEPSGFLRSRLLQLVQGNEIAMIYMTETCILGSMILIPFTILSVKDDSLQDIVLSRYPRRITDYFHYRTVLWQTFKVFYSLLFRKHQILAQSSDYFQSRCKRAPLCWS